MMKKMVKNVFPSCPIAEISMLAKSFPVVFEPEREMTKERTIIPNTSSIIAADTRQLPTFVSSLPNSLSVATVTDTEVAVKMTP